MGVGWDVFMDVDVSDGLWVAGRRCLSLPGPLSHRTRPIVTGRSDDTEIQR